MGARLERVVVAVLIGAGAIGAVPAIEAFATAPPPVTTNDFIPAERDLDECVTALPKPGCGSESRSDWHQGIVLAVMVAGLVFVGWRIVAGTRRQEADKHGAGNAV